jgi:hypothetical protein
MKTTVRIALGLVVLAVLGRSAAASPLIYGCGQGVVLGEVAVLQNDLDCTNVSDGIFVVGGTLQLNGHSIKGGTNTGIQCHGSCIIVGPGEVEQAGTGIFASVDESGGRIVVFDVSVHDNVYDGLMVAELTPSPLRVKLKDVVANNNGQEGIWIQGDSVRGANLTANANGGVGFYTEADASLNGLTAIGNFLGFSNHGVDRTAVLRRSVITGSTSGIDLFSTTMPKLRGTTCGYSLDPNQQAWGVCSGD